MDVQLNSSQRKLGITLQGIFAHLSPKHFKVYFYDYEYSTKVVMVPSFFIFNCYKYQSKKKNFMHLWHGCQMVWSWKRCP